MGTTDTTIQLYERLFFNCRQDDGTPVTSCFLKTKMAVGPLMHLDGRTPRQVSWRAIGQQVGYAALVYIWGWRDTHGDLISEGDMFKTIMRMSQAKVIDGLIGELEALEQQ